MSPWSKDLHVFTLVGIRENRTEHTFYRWAFTDTATALAISAFDKALTAAERISDERPTEAAGFVAWRLACSCKWASVSASRPAELAGLGFLHLLANRIDG